MENNEAGVIDTESPPERNEQLAPEHLEVDAEGGGEQEKRKENHIPISRAEEMWEKRKEKLLSEFRSKELDPVKKQLEDFTGKLTQGQLAWLKAMGWYKDEPEKPLSRAELEQMFKSERETMQRQMLVQTYEDRIRSGWEQVTAKWPELAGNKLFQDATLAAYSQNPNVPIMKHAESLVKELLDPYHTKRSAALQEERDARKSPDRRVVPAGRGAAGGTGKKETEPKKSIAEKIRDRLTASKEQ